MKKTNCNKSQPIPKPSINVASVMSPYLAERCPERGRNAFDDRRLKVPPWAKKGDFEPGKSARPVIPQVIQVRFQAAARHLDREISKPRCVRSVHGIVCPPTPIDLRATLRAVYRPQVRSGNNEFHIVSDDHFRLGFKRVGGDHRECSLNLPR